MNILSWFKSRELPLPPQIVNPLITHPSKDNLVTVLSPYLNHDTYLEFKKRLIEVLNNQNIAYLDWSAAKSKTLSTAISKAHHEQQPLIIFAEGADYQQLLVDKVNRFCLVTDVASLKHLPPLPDVLNLRKELIIINTLPHQPIPKIDFSAVHLHHQISLTKLTDYKRLVRFLTGSAFVVVMGGGGAKGVLHLGVLKALADQKIEIDAIGGTSIGANVAACFANTLNYQDTLEQVFTLRAASKEALTLKHMTWPNISLYSSHPITDELKKLFSETRIENLPIPYFAVSSDSLTDQAYVHRQGFLWEATRSSASLPGIFPPVIHEGKMLFDGGIINNLPVDIMRSMIGPKHTILAVSLSKKSKNNTTYSFPPVLPFKESILSRLRLSHKEYVYPPFIETITEALLLGSSFAEKSNEALADILIKPDLTKFKTLQILEEDSDELINLGYEETKKALAQFKKLTT